MNAPFLLLALLLAPGLLFLGLGSAWLLGTPPSERAIARLTNLTYALLCGGVAALGLLLWNSPAHLVRASLGSWYTVGDYGFPLEFVADPLSFPLIAATLLLVGLIGSFSKRYLHRDPGFLRFFLLLNLFAFGALLVFASASIDLLIAGWELVGITSVLLIAFFQDRPDPVRNGLRVFATYRLADIAILLAVFLAHHWTGAATWESLFNPASTSAAPLTPAQVHALAVLLVLAASGKSAQGPFAGWLPRAMEGPTPSSAVFYGAISVHAGAYLLLRAYPLISSSPIASTLLLIIGLGTALLSTLVHRTCADAKTSLAYATQTQLGLIFAEIALGFRSIALLHLCSHALIRSMQFLRAPSMLRDHHRVHAASGGHLPAPSEHLEALLPKPLQLSLYRIALGRGFYDAIVDRWLVTPAVALSKALSFLEPLWIRPSTPFSPPLPPSSPHLPRRPAPPPAPAASHPPPARPQPPTPPLADPSMDPLPAPFLSLGLSCLIVTALPGLFSKAPHSFRAPASISAAAALLAFGAASLHSLTHNGASFSDPLSPWFRVDSLNSIPLVAHALLLLISLLIAPKRDTSGCAPSGLLLIAAGTSCAYCASTLPVLVAGWWLTAVPFALGLFGTSPARWLNTVFLGSSAAALSLFAWITHSVSIDAAPQLNSLAFTLLLAAVALRKGLFPLHSWVVTAFEHGPLIPTVLLFNGHLGALLTARTEAAQLHQVLEPALHWLSIAALLTALLTSLRGFSEKKPRRLLAFLCISQASFILAGLATSNRQGITGALLHWFVVAFASSALAGILRLLEARVMDVANPEGHLGLAVRAPRLATFFLVSALALIGLPGTLGYNAEDLLFHGALQSHPWLGLCLLAATAFNAINLLRLYSVLFLGVPRKQVMHVPDALPRERWPLAACVTLLIAGGLLASRVFPLLSGVTDSLHPLPSHAALSHPAPR